MFEKLEAVQVNTFDVKSQLPRLVYERAMQAAAAGDLARTAISSPEQLKQRQQQIRLGIERCLGGLPRGHSPLNPTITGTVMGGNYRIEKVIFESRPSVYVTGNLYVPDGISQPRGAVLFLCGHREQAKHCDEYQTVCQYLVQAGLIVLAIDPVGQGERFGYYDPIAKEAAVTSVLEHERVGRQCLPVGDSLARYMLHDAMRAIDYLCSRPEVDQSRIGVTGHSGGGTQTALVMMYDTRIAAAAPGGFIMNRPHFLLTGKTQDAEQKWPGFSALGFDHEDIILAMAPRPVLILATQYDSVPIEGTRQNVEVNSRFWEMCGCLDKLELFVDEDVHRFTIPLALAAAGFFSQHLLGQRVLPTGDQIQLHAAQQLWCTKSGQLIGEMEQAKNVHQENVERLTQFESARQSIGDVERKRLAIEWLRGKVTGSRHPYALNPRHYSSGEFEGLRVTRSIWWSQRGLLNMALQFSDARLADRKLPVSIGIWEGGLHSLQAHAKWIQETCASGRLALVESDRSWTALAASELSPRQSIQAIRGAGQTHG
ncbi:MAG: hypothetical protein JWN30_2818 [Bacilli bacterium]|nr:hypothetical protein [Bacilli bacterium]